MVGADVGSGWGLLILAVLGAVGFSVALCGLTGTAVVGADVGSGWGLLVLAVSVGSAALLAVGIRENVAPSPNGVSKNGMPVIGETKNGMRGDLIICNPPTSLILLMVDALARASMLSVA